MLTLKNDKRETMKNKKEVRNQEDINIFGKKENYKKIL